MIKESEPIEPFTAEEWANAVVEVWPAEAFDWLVALLDEEETDPE